MLPQSDGMSNSQEMEDGRTSLQNICCEQRNGNYSLASLAQIPGAIEVQYKRLNMESIGSTASTRIEVPSVETLNLSLD